MSKDILTREQQSSLLATLQKRFEKNMHRHKDLHWSDVQKKLEDAPHKLWSLYRMEETGGEPDVVGMENGQYLYFDCAAQSPSGRRSLCYDRAAWEKRKEHKPKDTALDMAQAMGVEIVTEDQYRAFQELEAFDTKTSSWVFTPEEIRRHGGAIFCDRRYDHVFMYHNGADSYYASRGFRGIVKV